MYSNILKITGLVLLVGVVLLLSGQRSVLAFVGPTSTNTPASSISPAAPVTATATLTPTATAIATATAKASATATATLAAPTKTATAAPSTATPTVKATATQTATAATTSTLTPTVKATATATPTKAVTATPTKAVARAPLSPRAGTVSSISTSFVVQNTDPSITANISATFYDGTGTQTGPITAVISPKLSTTIDQRTVGGVPLSPSTYQGSVVLSSNTQLAAVVQELGGSTSSLGTGFRSDVYDGTPSTAAATTVLLPQLLKNVCDPSVNSCYNSTIAIQNTSATTSANATLQYNDPNSGQTYTHTGISILANSSVFVDMSNELPSLGAFNGSATLTSDQPVAVVVNHNIAGALLVYQGFTSSKSGTKLIVPQALKNIYIPSTNQTYGSGIMVMTFGGGSANIKVTYTKSNGQTIVSNQTANPSVIVDQRFDPALNGESVFNGSATIESSVPIIAIVNFVTTNSPTYGVRNTSFPAFPDGSGTSSIFFPLVMKNYLDSLSNVHWGTALAGRVMNGSAATLTLTYYSGGNTYVSTLCTTTSQPGFMCDQRYDTILPSTFYGSAVLTSNQPIVASMNTVGLDTDLGDVLGTYIGINQ